VCVCVCVCVTHSFSLSLFCLSCFVFPDAEHAAPAQLVSAAPPTCLERLPRKDTLIKQLAEHLDSASMLLFPLSYAIATAIVFRDSY
jgi:hypothetical protein